MQGAGGAGAAVPAFMEILMIYALAADKSVAELEGACLRRGISNV